MRKKILIAAVILVFSLAACNKNESGTVTLGGATEVVPQENLKPNPSIKKNIKIEDIDFSKYPNATRPAAFGYYFGLTKDQIEKEGVKLEVKDEEDEIVTAFTTSAPLPWADAENYILFFYKEKLLKIVVLGVDINNDSNGAEGKSKYKELRDLLIEKYGKPSKSMQSVGNKLWDKSDEFYQCLGYDGCGIWTALWTGGDKLVNITLKSSGKRGEGFIKIVYEAQPEWDAAIDSINENKKIKTNKGL